MRTKLLFVISNETYGGGENIFEQIIKRLDKDVFDIYTACGPASEFINAVSGYSKIELLKQRSQLDPRNIFDLVRIIKKYKIDVVNSQGPRADFYARTASKLAGVKKMYSTVATPPEVFDVNAVKKFVYVHLNKFTEDYTDNIFVPTNALKSFLISKHGLSQDKVVRISNGVDLKEFISKQDKHDEIRKEFGLSNETVVIGTICRLVWQKGLPDLLNAVKIISCAYPGKDIRYLLVGDGPYRAKLEQQARELNITDKIVFAGFRKDISSMLSAIDIYVLPSLSEGQPIGIIEAMAAGKPIVATAIEGIQDIIKNGETGLLVPVYDPENLSKTIISLVSDKQKAITLASNARKEAESSYDIEKIVAQYSSFYDINRSA